MIAPAGVGFGLVMVGLIALAITVAAAFEVIDGKTALALTAVTAVVLAITAAISLARLRRG